MVVVGTSWGPVEPGLKAPGGYDAFASKISNSGERLWNIQWGNSNHETLKGMKLDESGNVLVSGFHNMEVGGRAVWLSKISNAGAMMWDTSYEPGSNTQPYFFGMDAKGSMQWGAWEKDVPKASTNPIVFRYSYVPGASKAWGARISSLRTDLENVDAEEGKKALSKFEAKNFLGHWSIYATSKPEPGTVERVARSASIAIILCLL